MSVTLALYSYEYSVKLALNRLKEIRHLAESRDFGFNFMDKVRGFPKDGFDQPSFRDLVDSVASYTSDDEAVRIIGTSWEEIQGYETIAFSKPEMRAQYYQKLKKSFPAAGEDFFRFVAGLTGTTPSPTPAQ